MTTISQIKQQWSAIGLRERKLITLGVTAIIAVFLYFNVWQPVNKSNTRLISELTEAQQTLQFMLQAELEVNKLNSVNSHNREQASSELKAQIESTIKRQRLDTLISVNTMGDNYRLSVKSIDFDKLVRLLGYLDKRYQTSVDTIELSKSVDTDLVSGFIILK